MRIQPFRWYEAGSLLGATRPIRSGIERSGVRVARFGKVETSASRTRPESTSNRDNVVTSDAYGGFAKGMPKKLDKLPLVEPMKSFGLRYASISTEWESRRSVTNRIIQSNHWSSVLHNRGEPSEGEIGQTQPSEHGVVPGACTGERGVYASHRVLIGPKSQRPGVKAGGSMAAGVLQECLVP